MSKVGRQITDERSNPYADAWSKHGQVLRPLAVDLSTLLLKYPTLYFPWQLIFNKLLRVFGSPFDRDHWVDIQGYAQLVLNLIDDVQAQAVELRKPKWKQLPLPFKEMDMKV